MGNERALVALFRDNVAQMTRRDRHLRDPNEGSMTHADIGFRRKTFDEGSPVRYWMEQCGRDALRSSQGLTSSSDSLQGCVQAPLHQDLRHRGLTSRGRVKYRVVLIDVAASTNVCSMQRPLGLEVKKEHRALVRAAQS